MQGHTSSDVRRSSPSAAEAALLAQASPHMQAMITVALDTGMRQGEMLALRFSDIDLERGLLVLRSETTESRKSRSVPIATTRLRRVLERLRLDAEGHPKPAETALFSNFQDSFKIESTARAGPCHWTRWLVQKYICPSAVRMRNSLPLRRSTSSACMMLPIRNGQPSNGAAGRSPL
jgi:integrase